MTITKVPLHRRKAHITVDVEEWFHLTHDEMPPFDKWDSLQPTVEKNTLRILDMFDLYGHKGTFFFLGWVAKHYRNLVKEVSNRGHEIASHGFNHEDVGRKGSDALFSDISDSRKILEDITSHQVRGYRSPVFTGHSERFFKMLIEAGYEYDSSVFPAKRNSGDASHFPKVPFNMLFANGEGLTEFPISIIKFLGKQFPIGGGYFRAYPLWLTRKLIDKAKNDDNYVMFYFHPREVDKEHPRLKIENPVNRIKRYIGMKNAEKKIDSILSTTVSSRIDECL